MGRSMLHCPNCGSPVECEPVRCERCGYRPEIAREFLWIYGGGCAVILLGFLVGALGIAIEGAGPGHWSLIFHGWCPFAPWPEGYPWLGFIALGIALTGCGLGVTRQKRPAWIALCALSIYEIALAALVLPGFLGSPGTKTAAVLALVSELAFLGLVLRIGRAMLRVPSNRFSVRQEPAGNPESAA